MPRFRLSLLNAILVTTIAAMAIVIAQFWREIGPLRAEVRNLRNETGRLSIEDPAKFYAIEVRSQEDRTWKWRVWVPQGQTAKLCVQWGQVPKTGVPQRSSFESLEPGEHWITLVASHDPQSKNWHYRLTTKMGYLGGTIQPDEHWFEHKQTTATSDGVSHTTAEVQPNQKVFVLKRLRVANVSNSANIPDEPTPGFIIWLDRQ